MSERTESSCRLCEGTGWLYLMNSWFPKHSGYRRSRCGVCKGTGKSSYRPEASYVRQAHELRRAALGGQS